MKCDGKPYSTKHTLTCPFHSLAYEMECRKIADQTESLIHPQLGRLHTNQVEASHNVLVRYRSKNLQLARLHYELSTNIGLIQSSMTYMYKTRGPSYHWIVDLFKRMNLPVFSGVEEVLKMGNKKRARGLRKQKTEEMKKKRKLWKKKRKVDEKKRRENWSSKKGGGHDYGNDSMDEENTSHVSVALPHTRPPTTGIVL